MGEGGNTPAVDDGRERGSRLGNIIGALSQWATADLDNLSRAIDEIVHRRGAAKQPSLKQIKEAVAAVAGVPVDDLSSERRDRDVKRPRKVAMALCKHLTLAGYPRIGKAFERDHGAAMRACKQLEPLIEIAAGQSPDTIDEWAAIMLAHYERVVGAD